MGKLRPQGTTSIRLGNREAILWTGKGRPHHRGSCFSFLKRPGSLLLQGRLPSRENIRMRPVGRTTFPKSDHSPQKTEEFQRNCIFLRPALVGNAIRQRRAGRGGVPKAQRDEYPHLSLAKDFMTKT